MVKQLAIKTIKEIIQDIFHAEKVHHHYWEKTNTKAHRHKILGYQS